MAGPRILYESGSIGLGHVSKDLSIARELRRVRPDIEIVWLAGEPACDILRDADEDVAAENGRWIGASAIAERCTRRGRLNLVRYVYRSMPAWLHNLRIIRRVVASRDIDLIVGNEAWEVYVPLVARILPLHIPFVMIVDFIGTDVLTANPLDRLGSWFLNALWSLDPHTFDGGMHSAMFIGEAEDIATRRLGLFLPRKREHALRHYEVVGHVIRFDPGDYADRDAWRKRLGYDDGPLVVCAVGGTSIGRDLLGLCGRALPTLRDLVPGVRMVLVCGPRIAPESIRAPEGATVLGHVPNLHEHFACSDVAVVQCGASSTTELAALRRPFIYFPIEGHYEQELVAARLARYGAGVRMSPSATTPEELATALARECGREVEWDPLPLNGARKAAEHILRFLPPHLAVTV